MDKELREGLCEVCHKEYPTPWYAPNELWNLVMRHPDGKEASEKYGFVCTNCFIKTAQSLNHKGAWVVTTPTIITKSNKEARINERNEVALDNYRGKTFSQSTNYEAKFAKFIDNNEKRIRQLKKGDIK